MWPAGLSFVASRIMPLPPKQHITPTLIPPAAQGKFEPEWQTKNHFVDEIAPLNRYLFIYSFTYLLIPCDPRGKQIKIPASNLSEWKRKVARNFQLYSFKFR